MKANQPRLLGALEETVRHAQVLEEFASSERHRGRLERRQVRVFAADESADSGVYGGVRSTAVYPPPAPSAESVKSAIESDWQARRVLHVVRSGRRQGRRYRRESYYLTSRLDTAPGYAEGIRAHWSVENALHWTKDALMHEDGSGIRGQRAAQSLSLLKSLVLTRYRRAGYTSLKAATAQYANKVKELLLLLRT